MTDDPIEFELERAYDREELAAIFREFAAALDDGRPLRLEDGTRLAEVDVPSRISAEFEAEREADDEPPVTELELELEWDDPDGSSLRIADTEREESDAAGSATLDETDDGERRDAASATRAHPAPESEGGAGGAAPGPEPSAETEPEGSGDRTAERTSRFEVYEDRANEWRWRLVHWNGNIVADSGEGYASRSNAKRAARGVMRSAPTARIVDKDDGTD
ncbi:amphi-Trp domain-containing protein [Natronolimnohabitans innermongolicus]|uniref:Uncharacterized protein n=1 Tax=Natronolimnohabitans innermongolicus JCM 12255 TaxID=1227499 RepID=L9XBM8_9EURY|nr:amphi-Trp domain-containing protein [Natronolimnohabitans innermongolicus]ELY58851.1 hypothetical protein C493_06182 [Natronolimnohabitans innermongolicus JCM 12255]